MAYAAFRWRAFVHHTKFPKGRRKFARRRIVATVLSEPLGGSLGSEPAGYRRFSDRIQG